MSKKRGGWTVHEDAVAAVLELDAFSMKRKHVKPQPTPFTLPRAASVARTYIPLNVPTLPTIPPPDAPKVCVKKNCQVVLIGPDARFKYCPACRAEQREWTRRAKERKERMKQLEQPVGGTSSDDDRHAAPPVVRLTKEEIWARMSSHERLTEWMKQVRASGTLQEGTDVVLGKRKVGTAPDGSVAAKKTRTDNVYPEYLSAEELADAMNRCIANSAPRPTSFKGCFCLVQPADEHVTRSRILEEAGDMWTMVFGLSRRLGTPSVSSFKANGHNGRRADYHCVCSPSRNCGGTLTFKILKIFGDVFPGEKIIVKMTHD